jgi:hypothetical protein
MTPVTDVSLETPTGGILLDQTGYPPFTYKFGSWSFPVDPAISLVRPPGEIKSTDAVKPLHKTWRKRLWSEFFQEPALRVCRFAIAISADFLMAALLFTLVNALHRFYRFTSNEQDSLLWGKVQVSGLFDTLEFGVIVLFVVYSLIDARRALRGRVEL